MTQEHPGVKYPLRKDVVEPCKADFAALPSNNLRRIAIQIVLDVANGKRAGEPLDELASTGDLSDCFKVYFDERDDIKPRFRLVCRLLPGGGAEVVLVEVISVGRREAFAAYVEAARRLGRINPD